MSLRLAFDLDGTIADLRSALEREVARLFSDLETTAPGLPPSPRSEGPSGEPDGNDAAADGSSVRDSKYQRLTTEQQERLWDHIERTPDFWLSLGEVVPGTIERLATLAFRWHWDVVFMTTRPPTAGDSVQRQSQRWLESQGFMLPSVLVVRGSRGQLANALRLDAVVDDQPANCLDVVSKSSACAALIVPEREGVGGGPEQRVPELGIRSFSTVGAYLDMLENLDQQAPPHIVRKELRERFGTARRTRGGRLRGLLDSLGW